VAIHIPGTNTFSAEGVWVHNDMPATAQSSGSGSSSSGSGSGSGSPILAGMGSPVRVVLDLEISVSEQRLADLLAFLRRAVPFYEQPGGIRSRFSETINGPAGTSSVLSTRKNPPLNSTSAGSPRTST
jgi:hypothetical protein